jgi:acyl dehydratase
MEVSKFGSYYEEFIVGEEIIHQLSKTIFESDNNMFSLLTMNHHPLHLNKDYAEKSQHGQILVVGTLVFSVLVGITVPDISGKAIANLEYKKIRHLNPVFIGDTLYAKTLVLDKRLSEKNDDRGIISVKTIGRNQSNIPVLEFERSVLVQRMGVKKGG